MGKKVNPFIFRLGPLYTWKSRWYADKNNYKTILLQDIKLRKYLFKQLQKAGVSDVEIERSIKTIKVTLYVSRPGVVIGRGGKGLEELNNEIKKILKINKTDKKATQIDIKVKEIKSPDTQARLVAQRIADQLIARYPHRRAVTQAMEKAIDSGAKGIKIRLAGRINGAEIGRAEVYSRKNIPTQSLRSDIDYAEMPSLTRSGYVGIKVWIYKGERQLR